MEASLCPELVPGVLDDPRLADAGLAAEHHHLAFATLGEPPTVVEQAELVLAPDEAVVVVAPGADPPPGLDPSWLEGREARDGRPTAWLCRGTHCTLPVHEPDALGLEGLGGDGADA